MAKSTNRVNIIKTNKPWASKFGKLPSQPSALIRVAIDDLKAQIRKGISVDMDHWTVERDDGTCTVCLAGAVMRSRVPGIGDRLRLVDGFTWEPDGPAAPALEALNLFRQGELAEAFGCLGLGFPDHLLKCRVKIAKYDKKNRVKFFSQMASLANNLEKAGY